MKSNRNAKIVTDPLCVFTLSPSFAIQKTGRIDIQTSYHYPSTIFWRRGDYLLPRIRQRFKPFKRTSHALAKYLTERIEYSKSETPTLQEVLGTVKTVWTSDTFLKSASTIKMEDSSNKANFSSSIPSPIFLRRRLSVPETVMRKHVLAHQRSDSQDSDITQGSEVRSCHWKMEMVVGSDSNLHKKIGSNLMRKSTLMKRMWQSNKPLSESSARLKGSYCDWHYRKSYQYRSTHSLNSNQSSPEHTRYPTKTQLHEKKSLSSSPNKYDHTDKINLDGHQIIKSEFRDFNKNVTNVNAQHRRLDNIAPESHYNGTPNFDTNMSNSSCTNDTKTTIPQNSSVLSKTSLNTNTWTTTTAETESEHYSTKSTCTTSTTIFSDNSDSAYINSNSNFTFDGSSSVGTTTYSSEKFLEENDNIVDNENANTYRIIENRTTLPQVVHSNVKSSKEESREELGTVNESSTQTQNMTNLNVISNIQLSQSTLNLIFNQVMQDVHKSPTTNINVTTVSANVPVKSNIQNDMSQSKVIKVQQIPSFYLKTKPSEPSILEKPQVLKYMVSNVGTGSSYSKPPEIPQVVVPRFSALPRTTSMEVNTSSGESSDKESDTISLVDSLEGTNSPRVDLNQNHNYDDKPIIGSLSPLLPDNSLKVNKVGVKPASVFFVPIETNVKTDDKTMADRLPIKVRERLSKRQSKREQKSREYEENLISPKSDSNYVSASDNGNKIQNNANKMSKIFPEVNTIKNKNKTKYLLHGIESIRKNKSENNCNIKPPESHKSKENIHKQVKRKSVFKPEHTYVTNKKPSFWKSKSHHKTTEKLSPLYTPKNEYVYNIVPKTIYHKTEFNNSNKQIEILEIVECVEKPKRCSFQDSSKHKKSKIPVLIQSKFPNITKNEKHEKPVYLDFNQIHDVEPKLDQLIANILIDALNKADLENPYEVKNRNLANTSLMLEKRPPILQPLQSRHQGNKYQQTFEAIPEEKPTATHSSLEDVSQFNGENNKTSIQNNAQIISNKKVLPHSAGKHLRNDSENSLHDDIPLPTSTSKRVNVNMRNDEKTYSLPKGWISFYTVHKNEGSSESTSDEGYEKKLNNDNIYQNICNDCKGSPRHKIHSTLKQIKLKHNQSFNITDKLNTTNQKLVNVPVHNICMVPLKIKILPQGVILIKINVIA